MSNSQLQYSQAGSEARRALGFPLEPAHVVSHQERQRQVGSLNVFSIYAPEIVKAFSGPEKTSTLGCALGFPSGRLYWQWAEKRICNSSHSQNAGKAVSAGTQHVIPDDSSLPWDQKAWDPDSRGFDIFVWVCQASLNLGDYCTLCFLSPRS